MKSMDVKSRVFKSSDYEIIKSWYEEHSQVAPGLAAFPETTLIVDGIAAGSLVLTNIETGILENYISNPDANERQINASINHITDMLIGLAEGLKLRQLYVFTRIPSVAKRARKYGFKVFSNNLTGLVGDI